MKPYSKSGRIRILLGLTILAAPLRAAVFTEVSALINFLNSTAGYGYNGPTAPISTSVGLGSFGGCYPLNLLPAGSACTVSFTGTTDTTGTLNSSYDSLTINGSVPQDSLGHAGVSGSASAYATATAATATVGVSGTGSHNAPNGSEEGGSGSAQAAISDTLHFTVSGASATTSTLIPVSFAVHGTISGGIGNADLIAQFVFGGANFNQTVTMAANFGFIPTITHQSSSGWISASISPNSAGDFTFSGLYAITGSTADVSIFEYLSADGGGGANADFSHTGVVSINLPAGVTYTSDSAVFLSQAGASAIPGINTDGTGVLNGAINLPGSGIVAGSWVTIKGSNLSDASIDWSKSDFSNGLPTMLNGIQVLMNGKPAAVYYVQSNQVNVQAPASVPASGGVSIQAVRNGVTSNIITVNSVPTAPGLFAYASPDGGTLYPAAVFLDSILVGDPAVYSGTRKAKAGDVLLLFATGMGVSPSGVQVSPMGFSSPVMVSIDSVQATVTSTFLVAPGEWQINIVIPAGLSDGNHQIVVKTGGQSSQTGVMVPMTH
jgi:uncharacterized protein (TIGR03437 family)